MSSYFSDINEMTLSGRLTKNAKKVEPENSAPFVVVNIATNIVRQKQDEVYTKAEYNTIYFNKPHVKMAAQLITGDRIYVKGKLRYGEYKDKEGVVHKTVAISADKLHILKRMPRDNKAAQTQETDTNS